MVSGQLLTRQIVAKTIPRQGNSSPRKFLAKTIPRQDNSSRRQFSAKQYLSKPIPRRVKTIPYEEIVSEYGNNIYSDKIKYLKAIACYLKLARPPRGISSARDWHGEELSR